MPLLGIKHDFKRAAVGAALTILALLLPRTQAHAAELQLHTAASYEKYIRLTEQRIESELQAGRSGKQFLALDFSTSPRAGALRESLRRGEIHVEKFRTLENNREIDVDDGLIHHWIGAAFISGVKLDDLQVWLKKYDQHDQYFPEIEKSRLLSSDGDNFKFHYRLKRKKIITVVYNTEHTVSYRLITARRLASKGVATRITQLSDAGTASEKELPIGNDGGYLWRLNSYWRFEELDGGVYVECESVSLSRGIPFGVGWMIRGLVESVPRESLVSTLSSMRDGARKALPH